MSDLHANASFPRRTVDRYARIGASLLLGWSLACAPSDGRSSPEVESPEVASTAEESQTVPDVVLRSMKAHGIEQLLRSNAELTVTSKSGSFGVIAQPGDVFDYTIFSERDGVSRVHRHTNKPGEAEFTLTEDGEPQKISNPVSVQDFVSARVYFLFFPYRLLDPNTTLEDLGLETWPQGELRKVRLSFASGTSTNADESFLFWFDPATARVEQFAYSFASGVRFRRMINHRTVGGVLIADHENYAHNERVPVDTVTPEFAQSMELLSTVALENVSITPR